MVEADDLEKICDLGHGAYGIVEKMRHRQTNTVMAVKRITATVNLQEQVRTGCAIGKIDQLIVNVNHGNGLLIVETPANGPRYIDAIVGLPVHGAFLWCLISRGRCMDLYGSDGYQSR